MRASLSSDKTSEPVKVFLRLRPEYIDEAVDLRNDCINIIDDQTIKTRQPTDNQINSIGSLQSPRKGQSSNKVDKEKKFTFDRIFAPDSTQEDVYYQISPLVKATVRGYNTTVFAYGCTGSGKSYTMTGNSSAPGIIPRVIGELFSIIENTAAAENNAYFYVRISYVELYNNQFKNLLEHVSKDIQNQSASSTSTTNDFMLTSRTSASVYNNSTNGYVTARSSFDNTSNSMKMDLESLDERMMNTARMDKIEVRECQSTGVFLSGPHLRIPVTSAQQTFQLIAKGNKLRSTGATNCNDASSRSHAILTIHVESRFPSTASLVSSSTSTLPPNTTPTTPSPFSTSSSSTTTYQSPLEKRSHDIQFISSDSNSELRLGKMHLVDLAGSERLSMSRAEGDTLVETQYINSSLTALGDVLSALSKNAMILMQKSSNSLTTLMTSSSTSTTSNKGGNPLSHTYHGGMMTATATTSTSGNISLIPVPYRNSKLTHLLKDSLGGNSKTIMITNIRISDEYYQQTMISLMYASRAKKVFNHTLINRDIIGDTGIHQVTSEIERLKSRLAQRQMEFQRLQELHRTDNQENVQLKARLIELQQTNEIEKRQLEHQLKSIIHNQIQDVVETENKKYIALQNELKQELMMSQQMIVEQTEEINWLKKALDDTAQVAQQPVNQIERLQKVVDAWQCQAKVSQSELQTTTQQLDALKALNAKLTQELHTSKQEINQLKDTVSDKNSTIKSMEIQVSSQVKQIQAIQALNTRSTSNSEDEFQEKLSSKTKAHEKQLQENEAQIQQLQEHIVALQSSLVNAKESQSKSSPSVLQQQQQHQQLAHTQEIEELKESWSNRYTQLEQLCQEYTDRIDTLEKDKQLLHHKLDSSLRVLEETTTSIVGDTTARLEEGQADKKRLEQQYQLLQQQYDKLKTSQTSDIQPLQARIQELESALNQQRVFHTEKQQVEYQQMVSEKDALKIQINQLRSEKVADDKEHTSHTEQLLEQIDNLRTLLDSQSEENRILQSKCQEQETVLHMKSVQYEDKVQALVLEHQQRLRDELDMMKYSHIEECNELKKAWYEKEIEYISTIDTLQSQQKTDQQQLVHLNQQVSTLSQQYQQSLLNQQQEYQQKYENLLNDQQKAIMDQHTQEVSHMKAEYERKMSDHLEELKSQEMIYDTKLSELKNEYEMTMKRLNDDYKKELNDQLYAEREKMKTIYQEEMTALKNTHTQELQHIMASKSNELDSSLQTLREELEMQYATSTQEKLTKQSLDWEKRLTDTKATMEISHEKHIQEILAEERYRVQQEYRDKIINLESSYQKQVQDRLDEQREELRNSYELNIQLLQSQLSQSHESQISNLKADLESSYTQQLTEQKAQYDTLLDQELKHQESILHDRHQKILVDHLQSVESKWSDKYQQLQLYMKEDHNKALEILNEEFEEKLSHALEEQKDLLTLQFEGQIQDIKNLHVIEITTLKKEYEGSTTQQVTVLKEELVASYREQLKQELSQQQKHLDSMYMQEKVALEMRYKEEMTHALDVLKEIVQSECHMQYESERVLLENQYTVSMNRLKLELVQQHDIDLEKLRREHTDEINILKSQLTTQHEEHINNLIKTHSESMNILQSELDAQHHSDIDSQVRHFTESIDRLKVDVESEYTLKLATAQRDHMESISQLKADLESQYQARIEAIQIDHQETMKQIRAELESVYHTKLNAIQSDHIDTMTRQREELLNQHTHHMEVMRQEEEVKYKARLEEMTSQLEKEHTVTVSELKKETDSEMKVKIEQLLSELRIQLVSQYQLELQAVKILKDKEFIEMKELLEYQYDTKLKEYQVTVNKEHEELAEQYMKEKEDYIQTYEKASTKLQKYHNKELVKLHDILTRQQNEELSKLKEELLSQCNHDKLDEMAVIRKDLESHYEKEKVEWMTYHETQLREMKSNYDTMLQDVQKTLVQDTGQIHQQEKDSLYQQYEKDKLALKTQYEALIAEKDSQYQVHITELTTLEETKRQQLVEESKHEIEHLLQGKKEEWRVQQAVVEREWLSQQEQIMSEYKQSIMKEYDEKYKVQLNSTQNQLKLTSEISTLTMQLNAMKQYYTTLLNEKNQIIESIQSSVLKNKAASSTMSVSQTSSSKGILGPFILKENSGLLVERSSDDIHVVASSEGVDEGEESHGLHEDWVSQRSWTTINSSPLVLYTNATQHTTPTVLYDDTTPHYTTSLITQYKEELMRVKRISNKRMTELQQEIQSLKSQLTLNVDKTKLDSENKYKEVQKTLEAEIQVWKMKYQEIQLSQQLHTQIEESTQNGSSRGTYDQLIQDILQEKDVITQQRIDAIHISHQEVIEEWEMKVNTLTNDYQYQLKMTQVKYEEAVESMKIELQTQHRREMEELRGSYEMKYTQQKNEYIVQQEDAIQSVQEQEQKKYEEKLQEWISNRQHELRQQNVLEAQIIEQKLEYEKIVLNRERQYLEDKLKLEIQYKQRIQCTREEYEERIRILQQQIHHSASIRHVYDQNDAIIVDSGRKDTLILESADDQKISIIPSINNNNDDDIILHYIPPNTSSSELSAEPVGTPMIYGTTPNTETCMIPVEPNIIDDTVDMNSVTIQDVIDSKEDIVTVDDDVIIITEDGATTCLTDLATTFNALSCTGILTNSSSEGNSIVPKEYDQNELSTLVHSNKGHIMLIQDDLKSIQVDQVSMVLDTIMSGTNQSSNHIIDLTQSSRNNSNSGIEETVKQLQVEVYTQSQLMEAMKQYCQDIETENASMKRLYQDNHMHMKQEVSRAIELTHQIQAVHEVWMTSSTAAAAVTNTSMMTSTALNSSQMSINPTNTSTVKKDDIQRNENPSVTSDLLCKELINVTDSIDDDIYDDSDEADDVMNMRPKSTPIHILASASTSGKSIKSSNNMENDNDGIASKEADSYGSEIDDYRGDIDNISVRKSHHNDNIMYKRGQVVNTVKPHMKIMTSSSTPVDRLISAILEGDAQGIRTIVHRYSAGTYTSAENISGSDLSQQSNNMMGLKSMYWKRINKSTLPLHRAITGLHFHGSENKVITTLTTLLQLGANIHEKDPLGNSIIHKAITISNSKTIIGILKCLLNHGADPNHANKKGETPLHVECSRLRSASPEVVKLLLLSGADVNASYMRPYSIATHSTSNTTAAMSSSSPRKNAVNIMLNTSLLNTSINSISGIDILSLRQQQQTTPLCCVLQQAYSSSYTTNDLLTLFCKRGYDLAQTYQSPMNKENMRSFGNYPHTQEVWKSPVEYTVSKSKQTNAAVIPSTSSARKVWIPVLSLLLDSGASWDPYWKSDEGDKGVNSDNDGDNDGDGGYTQLQLLMLAYPIPSSPSTGSTMYMNILQSAMIQGQCHPYEETSRGKNAIYLLCERLGYLPTSKYSNSLEIIQLLYETPLSSSWHNSTLFSHHESSNFIQQKPTIVCRFNDASGHSIFDLPEYIQLSSLSLVKEYLAKRILQLSPSYMSSSSSSSVMSPVSPSVVDSLVPSPIHSTKKKVEVHKDDNCDEYQKVDTGNKNRKTTQYIKTVSSSHQESLNRYTHNVTDAKQSSKGSTPISVLMYKNMIPSTYNDLSEVDDSNVIPSVPRIQPKYITKMMLGEPIEKVGGINKVRSVGVKTVCDGFTGQRTHDDVVTSSTSLSHISNSTSNMSSVAPTNTSNMKVSETKSRHSIPPKLPSYLLSTSSTSMKDKPTPMNTTTTTTMKNSSTSMMETPVVLSSKNNMTVSSTNNKLTIESAAKKNIKSSLHHTSIPHYYSHKLMQNMYKLQRKNKTLKETTNTSNSNMTTNQGNGNVHDDEWMGEDDDILSASLGSSSSFVPMMK